MYTLKITDNEYAELNFLAQTKEKGDYISGFLLGRLVEEATNPAEDSTDLDEFEEDLDEELAKQSNPKIHVDNCNGCGNCCEAVEPKPTPTNPENEQF